MPVFSYDAFTDTDTDESTTIWCYCDTAEEAADLVDEIQTIAGSRVEYDDTFVYVVLCAFMLPEAIEEIAGHGFEIEEDYG